MVRDGILVPRKPMVLGSGTCRKPDGSIKLCVDYRKVMPRVQDLLGQNSQAKWLSKINLNKGFYQIPLDAPTIPKTAFCSPWGKLAFTRMPLGLMNVTALFQRVMDEH